MQYLTHSPLCLLWPLPCQIFSIKWNNHRILNISNSFVSSQLISPLTESNKFLCLAEASTQISWYLMSKEIKEQYTSNVSNNYTNLSLDSGYWSLRFQDRKLRVRKISCNARLGWCIIKNYTAALWTLFNAWYLQPFRRLMIQFGILRFVAVFSLAFHTYHLLVSYNEKWT